MDTSAFTFIMSLTWCSFFVCLGTILRHKTDFVYKYGIDSIFLVMTVGIVRMLLPFDPPNAIVIQSTSIMPFLQQLLSKEFLSLWGQPISRLHAIIILWAIGSFVYLIRIVIEIATTNFGVRRLHSENNPQVQKILQGIVERSKPRQKYRIVVSKVFTSPMLVGFMTPTILLPRLTLSDEQMYYVLFHEWNHFLHKHIWLKLFFNVLCAFLWWNQLMYMTKKDLDYVLEIICDRLVVRSMEESQRIKYVEATVHVMKQLLNPKRQLSVCSIGFVSNAAPAKIVQRCNLVLFPPQKVKKHVRIFFFLCTIALFAVSYVFILQPATSPPANDIEGCISVTPKNAFLQDKGNGTYELFISGRPFGIVTSTELGAQPYENLPIKNKEEYP